MFATIINIHIEYVAINHVNVFRSKMMLLRGLRGNWCRRMASLPCEVLDILEDSPDGKESTLSPNDYFGNGLNGLPGGLEHVGN